MHFINREYVPIDPHIFEVWFESINKHILNTLVALGSVRAPAMASASEAH